VNLEETVFAGKTALSVWQSTHTHADRRFSLIFAAWYCNRKVPSRTRLRQVFEVATAARCAKARVGLPLSRTNVLVTRTHG